ncbi:hypothetical protein DMH15_12615 [Streptomyces sp. WAC 06725]|uniref:hypothetical protein n=1 Tax=Streptomyces sp. WAC 06725 TaxID=2203209 RepID=UPI000F738E46|nr:hypothetical protein [Streptomyces sp. WAC 06725]RSO41848.1 hypothetical protein DMH15_12615 [Streptomyces sp. WAC 06725]
MEARSPAAAPRPVAEVNGEIRDFMTERAGRPLRPEEQEQYEQLLAAWTAAVNSEPRAAV